MRLDPLDGRGPVYRQLYRALRHAILAGRVRPGSRLPSTRWLASESGVARNRVVLAYTQLLDEGYATGRVGSGTYVAEPLPTDERPAVSTGGSAAAVRRPRLSRAGRKLVAAGSRWIAVSGGLRYDFSCGRPSFRDFPGSVWARLVRRHARPSSASDLDYAPAAGLPELRAAIAEHLTRWRGVTCGAEQVFVTSGTQQALGLAAGLLLEAGERLGMEEPHYSGARQAFEAARATLVPLRVDAQGLDVGRLAATRRVRMAYVTPAHQFPTGAVMPLTRRLALLAWARAARAHVIEDDYDSEYRYAGSPIESLHGLDGAGRVLYVGSFSKTLSPALRLGYLVVPPALVRGFTLAKMAADLGTPSFGQRVLADFIREGHLEVHLRRSRRRHAARRAALLDALAEHLGERVDVRGGGAGLHVMVVVRGARAADVPGIVRRARERDVGVYSTLGCYLTRPRRAELLLGHGSLAEDDIGRGVVRLAAALAAR
ncbi:MAG TPA: PLP-dependent aminotransferase family protein [Candidatus Binatia bacterium]